MIQIPIIQNTSFQNFDKHPSNSSYSYEDFSQKKKE